MVVASTSNRRILEADEEALANMVIFAFAPSTGTLV